MADVQVDIQKLQDFASTITILVHELSAAGFIPHSLAKDASGTHPDVGQNVDAGFLDGTDLYNTYDTARAQLLGDGQDVPGSLQDFINELTTLGEVAAQIAANYQKAGNEDQYSAEMVDQALNPPPAQTPPGQ